MRVLEKKEINVEIDNGASARIGEFKMRGEILTVETSPHNDGIVIEIQSVETGAVITTYGRKAIDLPTSAFLWPTFSITIVNKDKSGAKYVGKIIIKQVRR